MDTPGPLTRSRARGLTPAPTAGLKCRDKESQSSAVKPFRDLTNSVSIDQTGLGTLGTTLTFPATKDCPPAAKTALGNKGTGVVLGDAEGLQENTVPAFKNESQPVSVAKSVCTAVLLEDTEGLDETDAAPTKDYQPAAGSLIDEDGPAAVYDLLVMSPCELDPTPLKALLAAERGQAFEASAKLQAVLDVNAPCASSCSLLPVPEAPSEDEKVSPPLGLSADGPPTPDNIATGPPPEDRWEMSCSSPSILRDDEVETMQSKAVEELGTQVMASSAKSAIKSFIGKQTTSNITDESRYEDSISISSLDVAPDVLDEADSHTPSSDSSATEVADSLAALSIGSNYIPLRGIPVKTGSHIRFSEDGEAVESPTGGRVLLRGVPAASGTHTRFE